jgi:hypothetical protein
VELEIEKGIAFIKDVDRLVDEHNLVMDSVTVTETKGEIRFGLNVKLPKGGKQEKLALEGTEASGPARNPASEN